MFTGRAPSSGPPEPTTPVAPPALGQEDQVILPQGEVHLCVQGASPEPAPFGEELSDDLAQDTFIKAYTSLTSFKGAANFTTWLYRIAYNVFFDYIRSQKPTSDLEVVTMDADYSHEQQDISKKMDVYAALQQLREAERTCITLFYMEELEIKKIAEITGMAEGTVKSHLSRGKEKMANYLKQNGYGR